MILDAEESLGVVRFLSNPQITKPKAVVKARSWIISSGPIIFWATPRLTGKLKYFLANLRFDDYNVT